MSSFLHTLFFILAFCKMGLLCAQPGQIAIPRVEQMPNQPSPYNMRNWEEVALKYDSFVYDLQLTGQYLPVTFLNPSGVNYPQNQSYRQHTYIGTNSPFGNEAINVLPSLVGASLTGVDKGNQFGKDWLLMSQDFFNKANGENLYLNNPGAGSGGDWWYDMMPNVYFYQLYDLYPGLGSEADWQFTSIAGLFLGAVKTMGGHDAPWAVPYMNYRAWNFKTMEPNTNGVPEPEAAGAFAWVLYNAWKETGNPEYLKAAEWSIEFLNNWPSNPSYELQLPYGTLTAAKINATLGTVYNVEKMVNWSFDKGALRNWGTIVGTWGGFDVSGLIGEANDGGNDYAFQMNGMQQAAALVPMTRYDKRFARAIGKWVLNMANASRLFFHGFLPANLQDAAAWSSVNDPGQVIGYEALREKWQNLSPFSTGDAVQGGWAATNLALYGTSSIGYLGALMEKTDVDKILKLDLLKTDFYRDDAYPTFLFYNPHNSSKTVQFDAGSAPADVYEALSETFVLQNISGTVSLAIPANEAILVTVTPAGGVVSYDKNKMLVNGVVVDYRQSTVPFTYPPRFKALTAAKNPLEISKSTTVYATVSDADSDQFTYQWSASGGSLTGTDGEVNFTAPSTTGEVEIKCIVTDPQGNSDTASVSIPIVLEINQAPQILEIQKDKLFLAPVENLQLTCVATDANNDPLTYEWTGTGGSFTGTGASVQWVAPASQGIFQITVKVSDDGGLSASATTTVLVKIFDATSGNLIADYPFSGNANDVSGNQLHGQANGAILTADRLGNPQSAYYFNGGAQHIAVTNSPILNFQDGITVSCWLKADALPDKETFLLSHGSWQNRWKLSVTPEKYLRWTVNALNGVGDLDAAVPLETDSFYQVAVTYDNGLLALYLNGNLSSYKALSGKIRTTTLDFLMGQMLPGDPTYNFKGVLDEVKIYDYALTPDAAKTLFEQGTAVASGDLFQKTNALQLYPNPVSGTLTVTLPGNEGTPATIRVFGLAGRLVLEEKNTLAGTVNLDLKHLIPGIYAVVFISEKGFFSSRFVKI